MSEKPVKEKKGGNAFKIIIIVLLVLILLGGGIFAGMFLVSKNNSNGTAANSANVENSNVSVDENTFSLDEFLVNLGDDGGKKYVKVKLFIGYDKKNKKLAAELEPKKPVLRDAVVSVLRSKKSTDLTPKGTEDLKKEIKDRLNPLLNNGKLTNVYFYDILVQ